MGEGLPPTQNEQGNRKSQTSTPRNSWGEMITLSYGFLKPQNPDTGDIFFPAIEADIQQLNDHTHNGVNSAPLASQTSGSFGIGALTAAPIGGGLYYQDLTLPAGLDYDTCQIWFKKLGNYVYLSCERLSSSTFRVYVNDNTTAYVAYYR